MGAVRSLRASTINHVLHCVPKSSSINAGAESHICLPLLRTRYVLPVIRFSYWAQEIAQSIRSALAIAQRTTRES